MSTHASPQSVCAPQLGTHFLSVQATVPPVGAVHFAHVSPHASTVSPAHAGFPELLLAPLLLPPELELAPLDEPPDEDPEPELGSSPTQAPSASETMSEPVAMPRMERIRLFYHQLVRSVTLAGGASHEGSSQVRVTAA